MEKRIYTDKQEVAEHFARYFASLAQDSAVVHVALSGGSTPKVVFDFMAEQFGTVIDWTKVRFYWGDERCVPPDHVESNYKMTMDHLLSKVAVSSTQVFRIKGERDPEEEAKAYGALLDTELPKANGIPQFDLVILGMGDDGHTASIFPHEIGLWHADENCKVAVHPDSGQRRITINGKIINNAKNVAFLVTGSSKSEKVREIMHREAGFEAYPAALVSPESGNLLWFLDQDAAQGISAST
ncbi:6-phosphogluconolactonase [Spongiimicrobium sp. 2-473A-2-J]|uniref:6-phosphogluconolactonase n=1 Tax=Eudoraea algarum TaxID=3417568 RepID=UPI003D35C02F